jgi:hypothetical protein
LRPIGQPPQVDLAHISHWVYSGNGIGFSVIAGKLIARSVVRTAECDADVLKFGR